MSDIPEEKDEASVKLADEINQLAKTHVETIESKIRASIEADQEEKINRAVDDALAFYMPKNGSQRVGEDGGVLPLDGDHSLASRAQFLMSETWTPIRIETTKEGKVDGDKIRHALLELFAGAPLSRHLIGGDEEGSVLIGVMESCEQKYKLDPHARSIIDNLTNYTIGTGCDHSCTVSEVDQVIKDFANRNSFRRRIKDAARRKFKVGEHYFFYYIDKNTGDVYLRDRTKAYEIKAINVHPEDAETRLAYGRSKYVRDTRTVKGDAPKIEWFADINYFDQKSTPGGVTAHGVGRLSREKLIQMCKIGDSSQVRGTPVLYPALRFLRYYEDFILDRIVLNHERSKVVWVRKINGNRNIPGGRAQRGPVGGQILTETPQVEWRVMNPEINGGEATPDGRLIRMAIAAAVNIPEHILFQDPSNQVYASIRQQDTPFSYNIRGYQQDWVDDIKTMFKTVIREKVSAKKLKPQSEVEVFTTESWQRIYDEIAPMIQESARKDEVLMAIEALAGEAPTKTTKIDTVDVQVDVSLPDVVQEDGLKMAQTSEVLDRIGIISKTELAGRHGYNFKRTALLKSLERDWGDDESPQSDNDSTAPEVGGNPTYGKDSDVPSEGGDPRED